MPCRKTLECIKFPFLQLTVLNKHKNVLEKVQHVPCPSSRRPSYYWWGSTWFIQTPLENMEEGNYILIELFSGFDPLIDRTSSHNSSATSLFLSKKQSDSQYGEPIAWNISPLHLQTINSEIVHLEFYDYPFDDIISYEKIDPLLKKKDSLYLLECEICISKKAKLIDLNDYMMQPHWVQHLIEGESICYTNDYFLETTNDNKHILKSLGIV